MSLAPAAYLLFQRMLRHDPADPNWLGRDRFVLSGGHSSLTLYIQLYLSGYGLSWTTSRRCAPGAASRPGHPEHGHTAGVETTTGPLGQGVGNAVGMAMAARRERGLLDPDAAAGESLFDHTICVIASDGDIEEGVAARRPRWPATSGWATWSCSTTTTTSPSRATPTSRSARTSPRATRRTAGTSSVEWTSGRATRGRGRRCTTRARRGRRRTTDRPSFIPLAHDHRLAGAERAEHRQGARLRARRRGGGRDQEGARPRPGRRRSTSPTEVLAHAREVVERGRAAARASGRSGSTRGRRPTRTRAALLDRMLGPRGCRTAGRTRCPSSSPSKGMATRKASGEVLDRDRARCCPSCGAARPTWPSRTTPRRRASRRSCRPSRQTKEFRGGPYGRDAALRRPRARDGRDPERHRAARRDPAVRRHVPGLQRLHARRRSGWPR